MYSIYAELRDKAGLTDYSFAKASGIGRSILSDWKTGKHIPNRINLQKIASFFHVSVDYLMTGNNNEKQSDAGKKYYFSDETAEAAQKMFENKELRALFDVQNDMDSEDLKAMYNMALALKRKERGSDD